MIGRIQNLLWYYAQKFIFLKKEKKKHAFTRYKNLKQAKSLCGKIIEHNQLIDL